MRHTLAMILLFALTPCAADKIPTVEEALASKTDVWGEMAMRRPDGPSYEFFRDLLPPLRYVDASFRHYPIVLSAPNATVKARLISNGSAVNALARQNNWRGETGVPVHFSISRYEAPFGADPNRLEGPHYERGYLPIVRTQYRDRGAKIAEEAFGSVDPVYSANGTVFLRFTGKGKLAAHVYLSETTLKASSGTIRDAQGGAILWFGEGWSWEPGLHRLTTEVSADHPALLAVFTRPMAGGLPALDASIYSARRNECISTWEATLDQGVHIETSEPYVNNAWRSLVIGTLELIDADRVHYSAGNQYAKMYVGEGGDTIRAMALWGQADYARRMLVPLMDYKRDDLLIHQAGKKLQLLAHYYWLTRDASWFAEQKDRVTLQADRLVNGREPDTGLVPRESYCGDIQTPVYSLNSNANGYGGLVELSAVMADIGRAAEAERLAESAKAWKPKILDAFEKSVYRNTDPPFVPIALFGEEKPYDPLTATRLGGYWDLMAPYLIGSGLFRYDSKETTWVCRYLQEKGGLMTGMVRSHPVSSFWVREGQNTNDLYTLRYTLMLLQRDEVDRALVGFYGKLAQGLTRDTFIGAEGTCPTPLDEFGRQMYLPPNSASNAYFLWMLRYIMVQDWDMDSDGRPDTLRLMYATPRRWLEDGKSVKIEHAPTAFGEVSVVVTSRLESGEVTAEVTAPKEPPKRMLIRARVPDGWKVKSASVGGKPLVLDSTGAADITGMTGGFTIRFEVRKG